MCPKGFEPPTHGLEGRCSIQLSYGHICVNTSTKAIISCNRRFVNIFLKNIGKAGDGNRTHVSSLEGWCSTIELHPQNRGDRIRTCDPLVPNQVL